MTWRIAPLTAIALIVLGCLNLALLAEVGMQLLSNDESVTARSAWDPDLSQSIADAAGRRPLSAYARILAHPVFYKSRAPFVAPPPIPNVAMPVPQPVVVDPGLAVGGVMIRSGLSKVYLLTKTGTGGTWATEGEVFQGWLIKSIDKSGVRIEQGGRSLELELYPKP